LNVVLVHLADLKKEVNRIRVVHVPVERLEDVFLEFRLLCMKSRRSRGSSLQNVAQFLPACQKHTHYAERL
jgi:hypothetical protein